MSEIRLSYSSTTLSIKSSLTFFSLTSFLLTFVCFLTSFTSFLTDVFLTSFSLFTKETTCLFLLPLKEIFSLLFNSAKTVPIIPLYNVNLDSVEVSILSLSVIPNSLRVFSIKLTLLIEPSIKLLSINLFTSCLTFFVLIVSSFSSSIVSSSEVKSLNE